MLTYQLIQILLDDDQGVSTEAYDAILRWLEGHDLSLAKKIDSVIDTADDRWFIPEGTDLSPDSPVSMEVK
jgi:hypothetical protein